MAKKAKKAKKLSRANDPQLTVGQLIALLKKMPQGARLMFLNTDDPYGSAAEVEGVDTVESYQDSLGHSEAEDVTREAGLRKGQVVITGVTR